MGQRGDEARAGRRFPRPAHSAPARRCGNRCRSRVKRSASRARTIDSGRYWSSRPSPTSPSGITSMKVRSMPCAMGPFDQADELVLVDALERDRIDLDGKAGVLGGLDAVEHLVEVAPARDRAELRRIERVERDVDALDPVGGELAGVFLELGTVGGERQLVERAGARWRDSEATRRHDAAPDQRLAAGQAQLAHALGDEGGAQAVEFLQRQHVGLGQERHVFRHAVDAAEVAAVGDRHPQIGDGARKRIDQRPRNRGRLESIAGDMLVNCHCLEKPARDMKNSRHMRAI